MGSRRFKRGEERNKKKEEARAAGHDVTIG
jgi:hypothetical protein